MGDANASIPTPQPVLPRPMFGAVPAVAAASSLAFVAPAALEAGIVDRLGLMRRVVPVGNVRGLRKEDLPQNGARPAIRVEADSFRVTVDGEEIEAEPAETLPMAQRYFLF